jgi:hypothetical protein
MRDYLTMNFTEVTEFGQLDHSLIRFAYVYFEGDTI